MFLHARSKDRAFSLGSYPLETLPRDDAILATERNQPRRPAPADAAGDAPLAVAALKYRDIFGTSAEQEPAPARAPVPDDPKARTGDVKGMAYFMDAAMVGICEMAPNAWLEDADPLPHSHAIVLMIEDGKVPEPDNAAHGWVGPAVREMSDMRAAEIAVCVARHIRAMGFDARADVPGHRLTDGGRLAVMAGLAVPAGRPADQSLSRLILFPRGRHHGIRAGDRPAACRLGGGRARPALLVGAERRDFGPGAQPARPPAVPFQPLSRWNR